MFAQLLRFIGVGGLATITHVLVATIVHKLFSMPEMWSNFSGFCASVLISYFGHSNFTFAAEPNHKQHLPRFIFVSLTGLAASSFIVWLISTFTEGSFYLAMVLVALMVPLATFLALRFWVFSHRGTPFLPTWQMVFITLGGMFLFIGIYWNWPANHDTAWYLVATRKMLGGAQLYVDLIEVNPPLNFYLTIPAILIADFLKISDANGQYFFVALLYGVSLLWSGAILRGAADISALRRTVFFAFMALVFVLGAANNIAQREHLLVLFLSPWLMWYLVRPEKGPSLASSAFGAIGICIKPFFLVFPIAFLIRDMWRTRSFAPILYLRNLLMLAIGVIYVALVVAWHPEYLDDIVPMAGQVYAAYKNTFWGVLVISLPPKILGLIIMMPLVFTKRQDVGDTTFALAAVAALFSYVVQSTGFGYQLVPFIIYSLLAGAWWLINARTLSLGVVLTSLASALLMAGLYERGRYRNKTTDEVLYIAQKFGPIDSMMAGSMQLDIGAPVALRLGIDWVSRYPANWLYPGATNKLANTDCAKEAELCADLQAIVERNRTDNLNDILDHKPDLIVSDRAVTIFMVNPFTWMTFMKADPRFVEEMKNYTLVYKAERFDFYRRNEE